MPRIRWLELIVLCLLLSFGALAVGPAGPAAATGKPHQPIKRIILILLENQDFDTVMKDDYFSGLAKGGALFTNSRAVAHPSYPNYLALVGKHITLKDWSDKQRNLTSRSFAESLDAKGVSWKSYVEAYPSTDRNQANGSTTCGNITSDKSFPTYVRRHVPLLSFTYVQHKRCENVVDAGEFFTDIAAGGFPTFAFYTPDLCHDGHGAPSCGFSSHDDDTERLAAARSWLEPFLKKIRDSADFMDGTLVIVTFDEADNQIPIAAMNKVYTLFLGPVVKVGRYKQPINHYDVRRTIEDKLKLAPLIADGKPIQGVWQ